MNKWVSVVRRNDQGAEVRATVNLTNVDAIEQSGSYSKLIWNQSTPRVTWTVLSPKYNVLSGILNSVLPDHDGFAMQIDDNQWTHAQREQRLVTLWINGVPHHLEAIAVHEDNGEQFALDSDFEATLDAARSMIGDGAPFETTEIDGRPHVIVLTPYVQ